MNEAYERELRELYKLYLQKEKQIKEEWLKHNTLPRYGRGTIAGEEIQALNLWYTEEWRKIRMKYEGKNTAAES